MKNLGIDNYNLVKTDKGVRVEVNGDKIGHLDICCFCLLTEKLLEHKKQPKRVVSELSTYTKEDLSIVMDIDKPLGPIFKDIREFDENIVGVEVIEEYTGVGINEGKKSVLVEVLYNTSETEKIRTKLIKTLKAKHGIDIRS